MSLNIVMNPNRPYTGDLIEEGGYILYVKQVYKAYSSDANWNIYINNQYVVGFWVDEYSWVKNLILPFVYKGEPSTIEIREYCDNGYLDNFERYFFKITSDNWEQDYQEFYQKIRAAIQQPGSSRLMINRVTNNFLKGLLYIFENFTEIPIEHKKFWKNIGFRNYTTPIQTEGPLHQYLQYFEGILQV